MVEIPGSIIYNTTKISYKMITLTWYKSFKLNIINIFHIYSFSGTVKSIINIKERCRFENTFRIELFVKFKFWLIGKTIIFICKLKTPNDMETETLTPKQATIRDMRAEGLNTAVLELRKTVIVEEVEEFVFRSIDDGRILNGGKRIKRTIFSETTCI